MRMTSMVRLFESAFDRVVKSLDSKYGANLRHMVNESVSVGDLSGLAQTFDFLKPSSGWKRDDQFLSGVERPRPCISQVLLP